MKIKKIKIRKPRKINNTALIILFLVFSIILSCGTYLAGLILENYIILFLGISMAVVAWFLLYNKLDINDRNNKDNKDNDTDD